MERFIIPDALAEEQSLHAIDMKDTLGDQRLPLRPIRRRSYSLGVGTRTMEQTRSSPRVYAISVRISISPSMRPVFARQCRSRQSMPLMIERFCSGGLPRPRFSGSIGSNAFKMRNSTPVRSRFKPASPDAQRQIAVGRTPSLRKLRGMENHPRGGSLSAPFAIEFVRAA